NAGRHDDTRQLTDFARLDLRRQPGVGLIDQAAIETVDLVPASGAPIRSSEIVHEAREIPIVLRPAQVVVDCKPDRFSGAGRTAFEDLLDAGLTGGNSVEIPRLDDRLLVWKVVEQRAVAHAGAGTDFGSGARCVVRLRVDPQGCIKDGTP